jgi:hypothetical protein
MSWIEYKIGPAASIFSGPRGDDLGISEVKQFSALD